MSAFQDDVREIEIREMFKLAVPPNRGRHDVDAILKLKNKTIEFELKSTRENSSVTTARDVGYIHLEKWKTRHWLVGIYKDKIFSHAIYLPPALMKDWIEEKEEYIRADFEIVKILHNKIDVSEMNKLIGKKSIYTYEDARDLQKNQYSKEEYLSLMDLKNGYSPKRMLSLVHNRAKYLLLRGSTLNNPHIPSGVIKKGFKITKNFAPELKNLVEQNS